MKNTNSEEKSTNDLLVSIYKYRKTLLITAITAGIVSLVISFLIPELYKGTSIVFPTETNTVSFNDSKARSLAMEFGAEDKAEKLIQILESSTMKNKIIEKFNLSEVYEIEPGSQNYQYKLNKKYNNRISFKRTRYGSVSIDVLDKDPQRAADIANQIVDYIDTVTNAILKERAYPILEINEKKYLKLMDDLEAISSEIDSLTNLGVVSANSRSTLVRALGEESSPSLRDKIIEQIEINRLHGARYDVLSSLSEHKLKALAEQEVSYEQAKSDAMNDFNHKFIVETAYPSDKKDRPKKAFIILASTISSVLLVLILLLTRDRIREIKFTE